MYLKTKKFIIVKLLLFHSVKDVIKLKKLKKLYNSNINISIPP